MIMLNSCQSKYSMPIYSFSSSCFAMLKTTEARQSLHFTSWQITVFWSSNCLVLSGTYIVAYTHPVAPCGKPKPEAEYFTCQGQ